ncbi:MAG: hypothetical protein IJC11_07015 [Alphaproteobacteria bacterium]|nr:hypothetical protein [Alphaproteobacteria bacterium]
MRINILISLLIFGILIGVGFICFNRTKQTATIQQTVVSCPVIQYINETPQLSFKYSDLKNIKLRKKDSFKQISDKKRNSLFNYISADICSPNPDMPDYLNNKFATQSDKSSTFPRLDCGYVRTHIPF